MGAMQAQDYEMAKWAVGIRLPGSTDSIIEEALSNGEIIRTHLLRPTWHLVAASDIYWLLDLTAPHVRRLIAGANRKLGLDETVLRKSQEIIGKALAGNNYQTRAELMARLQGAGIKTNDLRSAHIMFDAEMAGLVCNGPRKGKQGTYALLRERVPVQTLLSREEALTELARRYFTSHGPATVKDFAWWSGLTLTESRKAIELAKRHLQSMHINAQTYWLSQEATNAEPVPEQIHFLPAFDEFLVSYCERSASLDQEKARQAISLNGIFKPVIVVDGQVVGLWKRAVKLKALSLELTFFYPLPADLTERIHDQAKQYADYMQLNHRIG